MNHLHQHLVVYMVVAAFLVEGKRYHGAVGHRYMPYWDSNFGTDTAFDGSRDMREVVHGAILLVHLSAQA